MKEYKAQDLVNTTNRPITHLVIELDSYGDEDGYSGFSTEQEALAYAAKELVEWGENGTIRTAVVYELKPVAKLSQ